MIKNSITTSIIAISSCLLLTACNSEHLQGPPPAQQSASIWPSLDTPKLNKEIENQIVSDLKPAYCRTKSRPDHSRRQCFCDARRRQKI